MDTARLWLTRQISAADLAADVTGGGEMEHWGEDSEGDSFPAQHRLTRGVPSIPDNVSLILLLLPCCLALDHSRQLASKCRSVSTSRWCRWCRWCGVACYTCYSLGSGVLVADPHNPSIHHHHHTLHILLAYRMINVALPWNESTILILDIWWLQNTAFSPDLGLLVLVLDVCPVTKSPLRCPDTEEGGAGIK